MVKLKDKVRQIREGNIEGIVVDKKEVNFILGNYNLFKVKSSDGFTDWINEKYLVKIDG